MPFSLILYALGGVGSLYVLYKVTDSVNKALPIIIIGGIAYYLYKK
jgi:hypothetical protein